MEPGNSPKGKRRNINPNHPILRFHVWFWRLYNLVGGFNDFFIFTPIYLGKWIQFDFCIFFKGVGSTTNQFTSKSPNIENPQNGWFTVENPIKMDDSGVPLLTAIRFFCSLTGVP